MNANECAYIKKIHCAPNRAKCAKYARLRKITQLLKVRYWKSRQTNKCHLYTLYIHTYEKSEQYGCDQNPLIHHSKKSFVHQITESRRIIILRILQFSTFCGKLFRNCNPEG